MVGTNNIERAQQFYDAVLGVLAEGEPMRNQAPLGRIIKMLCYVNGCGR
jgi:hypothetical protein